MRLPQLFNIALVALMAGSCSSAPRPGDASDKARSAIVEILGDACVPLIADASQVGTVCASIAGDDLKITFQTSGTWTLVDARLWAGTNLGGLQTDSNNYPFISQLPYQSGDLDHLTSYSFLVPLSSFETPTHPEGCEPKTVYIVPKAGVVTPDGASAVAWGGDIAIGERALYFDIELRCSDQPAPDGGVPPDGGPAADGGEGPMTCETAFGYGAGRSECFIRMEGLKSNRWGGTIGPLDSGTYTFDLLAGVGRCDLDKAHQIGWLQVDHDYVTGTTVCFEAAPGVVFEETHLFVGIEPLPRDKKGKYTVSPGSYPYSHDLDGATSDCYQVEGGGYVYIIAHAVACYGEDSGIDFDDRYMPGIER